MKIQHMHLNDIPASIGHREMSPESKELLHSLRGLRNESIVEVKPDYFNKLELDRLRAKICTVIRHLNDEMLRADTGYEYRMVQRADRTFVTRFEKRVKD